MIYRRFGLVKKKEEEIKEMKIGGKKEFFFVL